MDASASRQQMDSFYRPGKQCKPVKCSRNILLMVAYSYLSSKGVSSYAQTFEPGFDILDYKAPDLTEGQPVAPSPPVEAYLVLQGGVRIVGQSPQRPLPYSAALLHPGELFGADHRFVAAPLAYRAVAATNCQVVQVPYSYLSFWVDQHPALGTYWSNCMEQRVKQLFFKRFTPLQTLPSSVLTDRLLPQIQELRVDAGVTLGEVIKPYTGYFWLRSGNLISQAASSHPLPIGYGWSGSRRYLADGIAQTPLRLFHLPIWVWETSDLAYLMNKLRSIS